MRRSNKIFRTTPKGARRKINPDVNQREGKGRKNEEENEIKEGKKIREKREEKRREERREGKRREKKEREKKEEEEAET